VNGHSKEMEVRLPFNVTGAKKLLADAGYPNGFELTLDCPNNRYINDEAICQAVAAMWTQVGVKTRVNAMPRANYFTKVQSFDTSAYLLGWGVPTFDAYYSLQSLIMSPGAGGDGNFNLGKYSNPKVDALIDILKAEVSREKRNEVIRRAFAIHAADVGHIPLHHQMIPWAMNKKVSATHRADNRVDIRYFSIN
jgi:peptide/nickel transport system substrate-binding protein